MNRKPTETTETTEPYTESDVTLDDVIASTDIYDPSDVRGFYAAFLLDELLRWLNNQRPNVSLDPEIHAELWRVVDAWIDAIDIPERLIRASVVGVIDHLELISGPTRNGEAIDRLHEFEAKLKAKRRPVEARKKTGLVIQNPTWGNSGSCR
jgi:hypothetical protein